MGQRYMHAPKVSKDYGYCYAKARSQAQLERKSVKRNRECNAERCIAVSHCYWQFVS